MIYLSWFYIHWCFACLCAGVKSPRAGVTDSCELPRRCWELNLDHLEERQCSSQMNQISSPGIFTSNHYIFPTVYQDTYFGWSVVAHDFNPSTREAKAGRSLWVRGQPVLQELVPGQRNPVSKQTNKQTNKQKQKQNKKDTYFWSEWLSWGKAQKLQN